MKLVALAAAWVLGLLLGLELDPYPAALVLFSLAALFLILISRMAGHSVWPALLGLVLLMALVRVEISQDSNVLTASDGTGPLVVQGVVSTDPELSGPGVEMLVSVEAVDVGEGWEERAGRVLVVARPTAELVRDRDEPYFRYGDRLELTGSLEDAPSLGNFDYRAYLAAQGIHSTMSFLRVRVTDEGLGDPARRAIYDFRREVSRGIDRALPEPQAALSQARLLGLRSRLPSDVTEDFRSTGTSHLLAISGECVTPSASRPCSSEVNSQAVTAH